MNKSSGKYYAKKTESETFQDITEMFDGVAVLELKGLLNKGKPVNIYTEQWIDEQEEDFLITTQDSNENPVVIRENTDIELTFIIRKNYAADKANFDVLDVHDEFVDYMTNTDVWLRSKYVGNKYVHCVVLDTYEPTTIKLDRGDKSYIMGTIKFHCLDAPKEQVKGNVQL